MGRTGKHRSDREIAKTIALQLPDVEVSHHHNTTEMRVHNRVFATLPAKAKVILLKSKPGVEIALDDIDPATLQSLLIESWLAAAPAAVRQLHEAKLTQ